MIFQEAAVPVVLEDLAAAASAAAVPAENGKALI
jgi:hypothetical protein